MASNDQVKLGPWGLGINNRAEAFDLPQADDNSTLVCRDALNMDLSDTGRMRRRRGFTRLLAGNSIHSVFGGSTVFLYVSGNDLWINVPDGDQAVLRAGVGPQHMSYVELNGEVYYSNGSVTGKVSAVGADRRWGVPTPANTPTLAAVPGGGLFAGRYGVAITYVDDEGQESGSPVGVFVDVADGQGISVTNIPVPAESLSVRVYVTKHNDDQYWRAATLPPGSTSYTVIAGQRGLMLDTMLLDQFPPCTMLEEFNGRVYGVSAFDDRVVYYSEPLRYGLVDYNKNFLLYPTSVNLLKASLDGMYVGSDQLYWMGGMGPEEFQMRAMLPFGAVKGTGTHLKHSYDVVWFSERGWILGSTGGQTKLLSDEHVAPPKYSSGVALYREDRGLRQVLAACKGESYNPLVSSDLSDVETIREAT